MKVGRGHKDGEKAKEKCNEVEKRRTFSISEEKSKIFAIIFSLHETKITLKTQRKCLNISLTLFVLLLFLLQKFNLL